MSQATLVVQSLMDSFGSLSEVIPARSAFADQTGQDLGAWASVSMTSIPVAVAAHMIRTWNDDRLEAVAGPSRSRLVTHALVCLDSLSNGEPATPLAKQRTMEILRSLLANAQPTPQVAVQEDGGVETLWLVDGTEVVLQVDSDGSGTLSAYEPDDDLFSFDFDAFLDPLDAGEINEARWLLNNLGESVRYRVLA